MIGLRVPHEIARLLQTVEVPGEKVDSGSYHLTLFYLGDGVEIDQLTRAVGALFNVVQKTAPFTVRLDKVDSFPGNEDGVPIICPVNAAPLTALRDQLAEALDEAGVEYSKRWPTFQGHVTLSYADKAHQASLPPIEWGVTEVVLWGGDQGDDRMTATFPLSMLTKQAMFRSLVRLARLTYPITRDELYDLAAQVRDGLQEELQEAAEKVKGFDATLRSTGKHSTSYVWDLLSMVFVEWGIPTAYGTLTLLVHPESIEVKLQERTVCDVPIGPRRTWPHVVREAVEETMRNLDRILLREARALYRKNKQEIADRQQLILDQRKQHEWSVHLASALVRRLVCHPLV